jgi:hypothetical protein
MRNFFYYLMIACMAGTGGYFYYVKEVDRLEQRYKVHEPIAPQVAAPLPPDPSQAALASLNAAHRTGLATDWSGNAAEGDRAAPDDRPRTRQQVMAQMGPPMYSANAQRVWVYNEEAVIFRGEQVVGWVALEDGANPFGDDGKDASDVFYDSGIPAYTDKKRTINTSPGKGKVYSPSGASARYRSATRDDYHSNPSRFQFFNSKNQVDSRTRFNQPQYLNDMFDRNSSRTKGTR